MNGKPKAKITVQRVASDGAFSQSYRITKFTGIAEVTLDAIKSGQDDRVLIAGDQITHNELLRLCEISIYEVTTLAPA